MLTAAVAALCVWHMFPPLKSIDLSGTALPHLLDSATNNTADAPVSQYQSREGWRQNIGKKRVLVFFFSPVTKKKESIMDKELKKSDKMEAEGCW